MLSTRLIVLQLMLQLQLVGRGAVATRTPAAPAAVVPGSEWTLSTRHLALTFGERGVVSAVVDKATGRNLVLPRARATSSAAALDGAAAPQHSLISAVFVGASGKAASSPTTVVYNQESRPGLEDPLF